MSTAILKRCGTDKAFCKWLIANKALLQSRHYYIDVIVRAYKTRKSLEQWQVYKEAKLRLVHDSSLAPIKELFKGKDLERFFDFIAKQQTNPNAYLDYLKACRHLGIDMTEDKNVFPHEFRRWHDIRIDEYATKKAIGFCRLFDLVEQNNAERLFFDGIHDLTPKFDMNCLFPRT